MKKYEIEVTRVVSYEILAKDLEDANNKADEFYDNGELFYMKEIDSGSEITTVIEIQGKQ